MSEVQTEPTYLEADVPYCPCHGDVVFGENHTLSDVMRWAASQAGYDSVREFVEEEVLSWPDDREPVPEAA